MHRIYKPHRAGKKYLSALLAVVIAAVFVNVPEAAGYIPAQFAPDHGQPNGPSAQVGTNVQIAPSEAKPGEKITYTVTGNAQAPNPNRNGAPGQSDILGMVVKFTPSADAPLDRAPQASDFKWSDGRQRALVRADKDASGVWTLEFAGDSNLGGSPSFEATLPGTVNAGATGQAAPASVKTQVNIDPRLRGKRTRATRNR